MSVSKWAYDQAVCDGEMCAGDCDLCDMAKVMPELEKCNNDGSKVIEKCDKDDIIICKNKIDLQDMMNQLDKDGYEYTVNSYAITVAGGIRYD